MKFSSFKAEKFSVHCMEINAFLLLRVAVFPFVIELFFGVIAYFNLTRFTKCLLGTLAEWLTPCFLEQASSP